MKTDYETSEETVLTRSHVFAAMTTDRLRVGLAPAGDPRGGPFVGAFNTSSAAARRYARVLLTVCAAAAAVASVRPAACFVHGPPPPSIDLAFDALGAGEGVKSRQVTLRHEHPRITYSAANFGENAPRRDLSRCVRLRLLLRCFRFACCC